MEKNMETTILCWGYTRFGILIEILGKTVETTIVYWGYIGIMENANYYRIQGLGCRATLTPPCVLIAKGCSTRHKIWCPTQFRI